jgi:hypothetical protein
VRGAAVGAVAALAAALIVLAVNPLGPEESPPAAGRADTERADAETSRAREKNEAAARDGGTLRLARCPAGLGRCRTASGRIIYVERVDPDGDGDAHFVLASSDSITGPGISVIDVRRDLRPRPLPGPGDRISAAGPVFEGSYGQRQIEAVVVHTAR